MAKITFAIVFVVVCVLIAAWLVEAKGADSDEFDEDAGFESFVDEETKKDLQDVFKCLTEIFDEMTMIEALKMRYKIFDYHPESYYGPKKWGTTLGFPDCKEYDKEDGARKNGSPINFPAKETLKPTTERIHFGNFDQNFEMKINNCGRTVHVRPSEPFYHNCPMPNRPYIKRVKDAVTGVELILYFVDASVHWPSEHHINGKQYDLEIEFLFITAGGNSDLDLSVLFEIGKTDNPHLTPLLNHFKEDAVKYKNKNGVKSNSETLHFQHWFPKDHSKFFYSGSGMLPPCNFSIDRAVMAEIMPISQSQLNIIRAVNSMPKDPNGFDHPIGNNNRPIQTIHRRDLIFFHSCPPTVNKLSPTGGQSKT